MRKVLLRTGLALGLSVVPALASAQKALVYCPITLDHAGCDAVVTALSVGNAYPGGWIGGYDGTNGTVDLREVDLFAYQVFVVPSLADDATNQPYGFLRDLQVVEHLRAALIGKLALWSGTPDQGSSNRASKDQLINNLATWAGLSFATAHGPGLVALLDLSENEGSRYDWLHAITPFQVASDIELITYDSVRALSPAASAILGPSATQLGYASMAAFGFATLTPTPGISLDAVGATGTTQGGQVVLATMQAGNTSTAKISTDKLDYAPGQTVTLTGSGWAPGEFVTIIRHEDPLVEPDSTIVVVADPFGNFTETSFAPDVLDVGTRFVMTADGGTSGMRAQTSFTDAQPSSVTVAGQTPNPVTAGSSATYTVTVSFNGNANNCTVVLSASPTGSPAWPAPPPGGFFSFLADSLTSNSSASTTLTVTTPAGMTATTFHFTVSATRRANCQGTTGTSEISPSINLVVIGPIATTLTQAAPSPASVQFGSAGPITLSATLTRTSGGAAVSGATIGFTVDASSVGTAVTNATGVATLTTYNPSALSVGAHTLGASFGGQTIASTTYAASTGAPARTLTVTKADQTITFASLGTKTFGDPDFAVSATASSGLAVSLAASGSCTVTGTNVHLTAAGSCTITASQAGDGNYNPAAPVARTFTINKGTATITLGVLSFTYDATPHATTATTTPTGLSAVSVTYAGSPTAPTDAGSYAVVATLTNPDYQATNATGTLVIAKAPSTTTVTGGSFVYDGLAHTASALVAGVGVGITQTVTWSYSGSCSAAPTTVAQGTSCTARADYAGDANHEPSFGTAALTITKAPSTTTVTGGSFVYDGLAHTASALVAGVGVGITQTVTWSYSGSCSAAPTTVAQGTSCTARADYAGDANHEPSFGTAALTITKAPSTTTVTGGSFVYDGLAHTASALVAGVGVGITQTVTWSYSGSCSAAPTTVAQGTSCTARADYAGDANHEASFGTDEITITKAPSTTTVTGGSFVYDGLAHTGSAVVSGAGLGITQTVTWSYSGSCSAAPTTVAEGTSCTARADYAGDANHEASFGTAALTITKAPSTTTVTGGSFVYNGLAHAGSAVVSGAGLGITQTVTWSYSGSCSAAPTTVAEGTSCTARADYAGDANHEPSFGTAALTITKAPSTTTVTGGSFVYNGLAHTGSAVVSGAGLGITQMVTWSYSGSCSTAPTTVAQGTSCTARADYAGDANHEASFGTDEITITKAPSTTTVTGGSFVYNGLAHAGSAAVSGAGLGITQTVTWSYSGSCSAAPTTVTEGTSCTARADYAGDANHEASFGTAAITITKAPSTTTVTGGSFVYNGLAHAGSAAVSGAGVGITQTVTWSYSGSCSAAPTTVAEGTSCTARADYAGDANHEPSFGTDEITITKAPSTTTVTGGSFVYNGLAHTGSVAVSGAGVGITQTVTWSYSGSCSAAPTTVAEGTSCTARADYAGDANHEASFGTDEITITKAPSTTTVTGGSFVYDALAHTASAAVSGVGVGVTQTVTWSYSGSCSAAPTTVAEGTSCTARADYAGDANHEPSFGTAAITITKAPSSTAVTGGSFVYDALAHTASAAVSGAGVGITQTVTWSYSGSCSAAPTTVAEGTSCTARADYAGDANHLPSFGTAAITITKAPSATVLTFEAGPYVYRASPFTATAQVTGVGGLNSSVAVAYTGDCTNVSGPNGCTGTATFAGDGNHNGSLDAKSITITKADAAVSITPYSGIYDGASHGLSGTATGVGAVDLSAQLNLGATFTNVPGGTATWTFTGGTNYLDESGTGNVTISQKPVTPAIVANDKTYDGNTTAVLALGNGCTVSPIVPLDNVACTGTATFANKHAANGKTVTANGITLTGAKAPNYVLSTTTATDPSDIFRLAITVKATANTKVFDNNLSALAEPTIQPALAGGDSEGFSETYSTATVGSGKTLTPAGTVNDGNSGNNYLITFTPQNNGTITAAATTTAVTVTPGTQQYSDKVTFVATISPAQIGGLAPATGNVEFFVGTQSMGTAPLSVVGTQLTATLANKELVEVPANPSNGQLAPGTRTVTAKILNKDPNFSVLDPTTSLVLTKENASADYTGLEFWSTPDASTTTAQVTLRASVKDVSDGAPGDIRNARVNLVNRDNASTPFPGCSNLVPAPLNPGDYTIGTVSCIVTLSAGSGSDPSATYTVGTVVNNYYDQNSSADDQLVTLTMGGTGFITGGGHIINSASAGQYAGTAGAKSNFGFNVKFNKNKTNLQGHVNLIVRRLVAGVWKTYQVKSNAINSMGVTNTTSTTGVANFLSKANLTEVTNPLAPVSLGGSLQLQMTLTDNGEPGSSDKIAFTLWDGNTLLFSSEWTGSTTIEKLLHGGNLQVR